MRARIGVLYAPGTNGHEEMAFALEQAGAASEIALLRDLLDGRGSLMDYSGLVFPGGFSYGDHIAAGRVFAVQLMAGLSDQLTRFLSSGHPVLGVCNGDQVLMETGLLPGGEPGLRKGALAQNRSARFEGRWASVKAAPGSLWTEGCQDAPLRLPVAHGEGRLVHAPETTLRPAFYYLDGGGEPTGRYPDNPSGSPGGIAGILDPSGLILGLMPHPERAVLPAHGSTDGRKLFANMVAYCESL